MDVKRACESAADSIAKVQLSAWAGWIGYILEILDDVKVERIEGEFEYTLAKMRDTLNTRILEGRWVCDEPDFPDEPSGNLRHGSVS